MHATTVNGDAVSVTFTGNSVALLLETGSAAGQQTFDVSVDGQSWGAIATPAVSGSPLSWVGQQLAYSTAGLSDRTHTLKITKKSGSWLVVDAFIVGSSRGVPGSAKSWQLSSAHPEKFWHLIHGVPNETAMREIISLSKRRNAGYVYVTDDATTFDGAGNYTNVAWDTIALYWGSELVAASRCDLLALCDA